MKVLLKRALVQVCVITVVCLLASIIGVRQAVLTGARPAQPTHTVVIDAGHGGFDGGAVAGDGTVEKHINLIIATKLQKMLEFNGYRVIMTRTEDEATDNSGESIAARKKSDLKNRLLLMEDNPDSIYVSIHLNKFTTSAASGAQVFYTPNFIEAQRLGSCIQASVIRLLQPDNHRVVKQGNSSTYLLERASVPAVIVECGFLSNSAELERLKDDRYRSQMAFAILCGITDFFEKE